MTVPPVVAELVERFQRDITAYRSPHYNEAQTRQEFIDPFFEALGWDMSNAQGAPVAYREVVHEDAIKISGKSKAPDYSFRVGGERRFFVEAKKPSVNIEADIRPAYQLRRYAWSSNLPISILSDFEEFAIYDCRVMPNKDDSALAARELYIPYTKYEEQWDQIAGLFSREAVLAGSLDHYAESMKTKRGTRTVDAAFLKEIESWREALARDIATRNISLSQRNLNLAVQMTIDRIIFLRICEDRGIEPYGHLHLLLEQTDIYGEMCRLFRQADDRYNSGLFHFRQEPGHPDLPDDLTLSLSIGNGVLSSIIVHLYYPDSPYEFSVLPADILGQVYEQFLGKVIQITPTRAVKVEEKPAVRKAGGVYYTPTYIVDYIISRTIDPILKGKTPLQVSRLSFLDPSCGSGSFLIALYQRLLDWHREYYVSDDPTKHRDRVYQGPLDEWRLTTDERKRILLNNVYGVDIDPQAVETTKLSLLLKVLEGESNTSLWTQLQLIQSRALPDLGSNVKCGNSLIGPDYFHGQQLSFLDDESRYRVNVFSWVDEFPNILGTGKPGFDAIIGNPPWGANFAVTELSYLRTKCVVPQIR